MGAIGYGICGEGSVCGNIGLREDELLGARVVENFHYRITVPKATKISESRLRIAHNGKVLINVRWERNILE